MLILAVLTIGLELDSAMGLGQSLNVSVEGLSIFVSQAQITLTSLQFDDVPEKWSKL